MTNTSSVLLRVSASVSRAVAEHPDPLVADPRPGEGRSYGVPGFFWLLLWCYFLVAFLVVLFRIIGDLFRDRELGGGMKAVWFIGLLVVPIVSVVIYLGPRRRDGQPADEGGSGRRRGETDKYIHGVAGRANSAEEIASAKRLLDAGTITQVEFEHLKAKALRDAPSARTVTSALTRPESESMLGPKQANVS